MRNTIIAGITASLLWMGIATPKAVACHPEFVSLKVADATTTQTSGSFAVEPGQRFWVELTYKNTSTATWRGGVTASLPGFDGSVRNRNAVFGAGKTQPADVLYFSPGSYNSIYHASAMIEFVNPSEHHFIESFESGWSVNEEQTLRFQLEAPRQPGSFTIRTRGWLSDSSWREQYLNPTAGEPDQQGYPCFVYTVNVEAPAPADLKAITPWCRYTTWAWGSSQKLDLRVWNQGSEAASGITIKLVASNNPIVGDGDDHVIRTWGNQTIPGSDTWDTFDHTLDLPSTPYPNMPASGTVYFFLTASSAGPGDNMADNQAYTAVTMTSPDSGPGITVNTPLRTGQTVTKGEDVVRIEWQATNAGPGSSVSLMYDQDLVFGNGNERVIASGLGSTGHRYWNPADVAPGEYHIVAKVESGAQSAHAYASGSAVITEPPPPPPSTAISDPVTVDTRDLEMEITDVHQQPHFGSDRVDFIFRGRVTSQSGPEAGIVIGVQDPWRTMTIADAARTDDQGYFQYDSSASKPSGNYLFVFMIANKPQLGFPVAVRQAGDDWVELPPETKILLGQDRVSRITGSTVSSSYYRDGSIFDAVDASMRRFASSVGRVAARTVLDTLAARAEDPVQQIASAGVMACLLPEATVTKLACTVGVGYTAGATVRDGAKNLFLSIIDELAVSEETKRVLSAGIEAGAFAAGGIQLAKGGGSLDIASFSYETARYLPGSATLDISDGRTQVEFVTQTPAGIYGIFAVRLLGVPPELVIDNPNDDTLRVQITAKTAGRHYIFRRQHPHGTWGTSPLDSRILMPGDQHVFIDSDVERGTVYEYAIGHSADFNPENAVAFAPGKAERVVVLVRGLDLFSGPDADPEERWRTLRERLQSEGFEVWDACYDPLTTVDLITGSKPWHEESIRLRGYLNDKAQAYDSEPYAAPLTLDIVAHSMGALISRDAIANGTRIPVRNLITLSGVHQGSVWADYSDLIFLFELIFKYPVNTAYHNIFNSRAIESLKPSYVERHWPALPASVKLYAAGGTTPDPALSSTRHFDQWNITYDGIASVFSTHATGRLATGNGTSRAWSWGSLSKAAERSFVLDHFDIKTDSAPLDWTLAILEDRLESFEPTSLAATSLDHASYAPLEEPAVDTTVFLAWDRDAVLGGGTNTHFITVDSVTELDLLFSSPSGITCVVTSPGDVPYAVETSMTIPDPEPGVWTATVASDLAPGEMTEYLLVSSARSPAAPEYDVPEHTVFMGAAAGFGVTADTDWAELHGTTGTVAVIDGTNTLATLPLLPDGSNAVSAVCAHITTQGYFNVRFDVQGARLGGEPFNRVHFAPITMQQEQLRFDGEPWVNLYNPARGSRLQSIDVTCELLALTSVDVRLTAEVFAGDNRVGVMESPVVELRSLERRAVTLSIVSENIQLDEDTPLGIGPITALSPSNNGLLLATHPGVTTPVVLASSVGPVQNDGGDNGEPGEFVLRIVHAEFAQDISAMIWNARAGKTYRVETTGDLWVDWIPAPSGTDPDEQHERTADADGLMLYFDPTHPADGQRFYRILELP